MGRILVGPLLVGPILAGRLLAVLLPGIQRLDLQQERGERGEIEDK